MTDIPVAAARPADDPAALAAVTREVMADFVRLFYVEKDVRQAFGRYVREDYIQHNPEVADGRAAAVDFLVPLFSNPDLHNEVLHVLVDGDYAAVHVHAGLGGTRGAVLVDLFRLEGSLIAEHWDVIQFIPDQAANDHPMI